jgi:rhodanese-related sulfurtransferase
MNARVILSAVFVFLGLIIAAVPNSKTLNYRLSPDQMLVDLNGRSQYISPDEVADLLIQKDPSIRLIDIRSEEEYQKFHLPGAYNIPMSDLLNAEYRFVIDQDLKINVFYSNSSVKANEAYIITRQLGYNNNYVLEGGLNYWAEGIMNPEKPGYISPNEEFARYDFRIGAGMALGGGAAVSGSQSTTPTKPPAIKRNTTKKKAQGGC